MAWLASWRSISLPSRVAATDTGTVLQPAQSDSCKQAVLYKYLAVPERFALPERCRLSC